MGVVGRVYQQLPVTVDMIRSDKVSLRTFHSDTSVALGIYIINTKLPLKYCTSVARATDVQEKGWAVFLGCPTLLMYKSWRVQAHAMIHNFSITSETRAFRRDTENIYKNIFSPWPLKGCQIATALEWQVACRSEGVLEPLQIPYFTTIN